MTRGLPWLPIGSVIVAAALVLLGVTEGRKASRAARLPVLPNLPLNSPLREHLRDKDRAARTSPSSIVAVGDLCLAYHADMFYDHADRCYEDAEDLDPQDWRWTYYRAVAAGERGGVEALVDGMRHVTERAPEFGPAWLRLGEAEFKARRYDRAETAWRRASSLSEPPRTTPAGSPAHVASFDLSTYAMLGLARIAVVQGQAEAASRILEELTSNAPRFGPAFRLLAESYALVGRTADAKRASRRANGLPPYAPYADPMIDVLARESRSTTFLLQQAAQVDLASDPAWAEYLTRRALEFDPHNPDVVSKLGRTLRSLNRNNEALGFLEMYRQMQPDDVQVIGQIGSCLSDLGRAAEAEPLLRRAAQELDDAVSRYNLGVWLARLGRFDEAVAEYRKAIERDPDGDETVRNNLAVALISQGRLEAASQQLLHVLEVDPENADARTNLGIVFAHQGQIERAADQFREALRLDPQQLNAREALRAIGR